jgi:hypothetical protein
VSFLKNYYSSPPSDLQSPIFVSMRLARFDRLLFSIPISLIRHSIEPRVYSSLYESPIAEWSWWFTDNNSSMKPSMTLQASFYHLHVSSFSIYHILSKPSVVYHDLSLRVVRETFPYFQTDPVGDGLDVIVRDSWIYVDRRNASRISSSRIVDCLLPRILVSRLKRLPLHLNSWIIVFLDAEDLRRI